MDTSFLIVALILLLSVGFAVYFALKYQKVKSDLAVSEVVGETHQNRARRELAHRQALEASRAQELREAYTTALEAAKTKTPEQALAELRSTLDKIKKARKQ